MKDVFTYIKAAQFFPKYAPLVTNWKNKCRGYNGKGMPLEFSDYDKAAILVGIYKMVKEVTFEPA